MAGRGRSFPVKQGEISSDEQSRTIWEERRSQQTLNLSGQLVQLSVDGCECTHTHTHTCVGEGSCSCSLAHLGSHRSAFSGTGMCVLLATYM